MKERQILFSGEMVRAILDGRKTMTRRVVKHPQDISDSKSAYQAGDGSWVFWDCDGGGLAEETKRRYSSGGIFPPYGMIGDRLWVRETWLVDKTFDDIPPRKLSGIKSGIEYPSTDIHLRTGKKRPSIFMPRWASRILLEITNVRVERLQDISEEDAIAEGIEEYIDLLPCTCWKNYEKKDGIFLDNPEGSFQSLWQSINGNLPGKTWNDNPFVWVIEFRRIKQ